MRSPVDFEKAHHYDRCRESIDSDEYPSPNTTDETRQSLTNDATVAPPPPPYSAFSVNRRRFILAVVTAAGFFGPLCGAVYLPSLKLFQTIFKTSEAAVNGTVSMYMVVFAIAPLFGAAASDIGGRKTVYMVGLGSFLVANTLLAALPAHISLLYFLRIFQAFGSCIVFSVGAGTVADITEPARRASALAWFLMGPQLGPILGPLIGGQFATETKWRWVFGFLSLASLPVYLAIVFCMPETLRSLVGNGTHLIVSFNGAFQFAGLYGMYVSFPTIWQDGYNWTTAEVGYGFLCPGIAMFVASIFVGRLSDYMRKKAIANSPDGKVAPERRIAIQIPGFLIAAAGKIMFGWFTYNRVHPAAGLFGSALASVGVSVVFVTSTSFQTECDPTQTASLVALGGFLRNVAAAICAVIMGSLLENRGWGWAFTGLGILDLLCIPGILLIMVRGAKFRESLKRDQQQNK